MSEASVRKIVKRNGVAGQVEYVATVEYPGEEPSRVSFVGSVYGGPVVMVTESGAQMFVTDPSRFGTFGPEWIRRFFGQS